MNLSSLLLNGVIIAAMYASAWPFVSDLIGVADQPVPRGLYLLVVLSAISNIIVIGYHYTVPPHPKFLMVPWRRAILRVHITSGTVELFAGLAALVMDSPEVAARVMAASALLFHAPSAFAQTPIVFGSRAIMRPGYLMCIGLHLFCAANLWVHPASAYWLVCTFLVFNVYVWCRIYYFVFDKLGLFAGARYSVSIVAAGLTTTPAILGPNAIVVLFLGCAISMVLVKLFFLRGPTAWADFVRERARDSALPDEVRSLFFGAATEHDDRAAEAFFDHLDADRDGALSTDDIKRLLVDAAISASVADRFLESRVGATARLDRQQFKERLWPVREVRERAFLVKALAAARSERDKAELVFQRLDVDGDGVLSRVELDALLREWSMPPKEVDRWLARAGAKDHLTFEQFRTHLRPVWRFIFYDVVEAQHGSREDMILRAVTAAKDASAQTRVRAVVHQELVSQVPFLASADPALMEALSASLVEGAFAEGAELFREGEAGDTFFIIHSGKVRVTQKGERLAELGPGDYLGEGALLTQSVRSATATALSSVKVLSMTRGSFQYLVDTHASLRQAVATLHAGRHEEQRLHALHQALQRDLLGTVPFLAQAQRPVLDQLVQALSREERRSGQVVFTEGDPGDAFFLIGGGTVRITRADETVAELGPGAWFGEGALLSGERRSASAIVEADAALYRLPKQAFDAILATAPGVATAVTESHRARQADHVRHLLERRLLRRVPFLREASAEMIDSLVADLEPSSVEAGATVVQEGTVGDRLFLIVRGTVRVERDGQQVAELWDGACFGERAVLDDAPRAATVVALEKTDLLALKRDAVERLTARWPEVREKLTIKPARPSRPTTVQGGLTT